MVDFDTRADGDRQPLPDRRATAMQPARPPLAIEQLRARQLPQAPDWNLVKQMRLWLKR